MKIGFIIDDLRFPTKVISDLHICPTHERFKQFHELIDFFVTHLNSHPPQKMKELVRSMRLGIQFQ